MSKKIEPSAPVDFDALVKAVRRLRRAEIEQRRAIAAADPPRINKAGSSYWAARHAVYKAAGVVA